MNKILSNMMLHCNEKITSEQVVTLQAFKDTPSDFKLETKGYIELLNFSLDKYAPHPDLNEE